MRTSFNIPDDLRSEFDETWQAVISGVAAQQVLGPFSRNSICVRRAGSLITDEIERVEGVPTDRNGLFW